MGACFCLGRPSTPWHLCEAGERKRGGLSYTHLEILLWHKSQAVMTHEGKVDEEVHESKEAMQPQELTPARREERETHMRCRPFGASQHCYYPCHAISIHSRPSHHYGVLRLTPTTTGLVDQWTRSRVGLSFLFCIFSPDPSGWFPDQAPRFTHRERRA